VDSFADPIGYIAGACVAFALIVFTVVCAKIAGRNQNLKPPPPEE